MTEPSYLTAGDEIRIISTARKISETELFPAIQLFEKWGLKVSLGEHLYNSENQFAGTVKQRTSDLQNALNDQKIKAIICARGGYGTVQIIDEVNFNCFRKFPKWIVGYSDVTVLHNHINKNYGIPTIHATMPINFPQIGEDESTFTLKSALFGEKYQINFVTENTQNWKIKAPIVGGNLSIIYSLTGTASQINCNGKLLFIEDLDEYLYHIDRMLMNLKRTTLLNGCLGLLIGGMSDMNDNTIPFGRTALEIIHEKLSFLNIPIITNVPAGHIKRNLALIMNKEVSLEIENSQATIIFHGRA